MAFTIYERIVALGFHPGHTTLNRCGIAVAARLRTMNISNKSYKRQRENKVVYTVKVYADQHKALIDELITEQMP